MLLLRQEVRCYLPMIAAVLSQGPSPKSQLLQMPLQAVSIDIAEGPCRAFTLGSTVISLGDVVALEGDQLGLVQALWQDNDGKRWLQTRCMLHGRDTVLGDAAACDELFITNNMAIRHAMNLSCNHLKS